MWIYVHSLLMFDEVLLALSILSSRIFFFLYTITITLKTSRTQINDPSFTCLQIPNPFIDHRWLMSNTRITVNQKRCYYCFFSSSFARRHIASGCHSMVRNQLCPDSIWLTINCSSWITRKYGVVQCAPRTHWRK